MEDLHSPDFEFFQTFCEPADVGFAGSSRARTYVIGVHTEKSMILKDPLELHETVRQVLRHHAATMPQDYLVATATEVQLEAEGVARRRGITYQPNSLDMRYLLTQREAAALQQYEDEFYARYGQRASSVDSLFVFLGDNPSYSLTWSVNGRLPTFRTNQGFLWSVKHRRWLTAKERLVSLGWPVTGTVATAMAVPLIPATDVKRASDLAGNSMHFLNAGAQQLLALSCFGPDGAVMCVD